MTINTIIDYQCLMANPWVAFLTSIILLTLITSVNGYTDRLGIEDGDRVSIEYTGYVNDTNEIFDQGTADFIINSESLILGFYEGVLGMKIGDEKTFIIPPEKGYTNPESPLYGETLRFTVKILDVLEGSRVEISSTSNTTTTTTSSISYGVTSDGCNVFPSLCSSDETTSESPSVSLPYSHVVTLISLLSVILIIKIRTNK